MLGPRPPTVAPKAAEPAPEAPAQPAEVERPDALASEVAQSVRELRTGAGLSERAAARLLGTSQTQLRRMEDPRYLPSLRSLARVAAAYGQRVKVSFEPKDRPTARPQRAPARPKPAPVKPKRTGGTRGRAGRTRRRS